MAGWNYIVIGSCLLLAIFLCVKEWNRPKRSRLPARLVASIAAVLFLAFIALPVRIKQAPKTGAKKAALLITEGAEGDSVRSFLRSYSGPVRSYSVAQYFYGKPEAVDELHVFGNGVVKEKWEQLPPTKIVFHPPSVSGGFTAINWTSQIKFGEALIVQGGYNNTQKEAVTLLLQLHGTTLDSLVIPGGKQVDLELSAPAKNEGRIIFDLLVLQQKDTIRKERFPVEVKPVEKPALLVLSSNPGFEQKFLVNWLAENKYRVAVRNRISKDIYSTAFVNMESSSLTVVSASLLEKFDLLLTDPMTLSRLPAASLEQLRRQVTEHGMGLLLIADSLPSGGSFYSRPFRLQRSNNNSIRQVVLQINGLNKETPLSMEQPASIRSQQGIRPLVLDTDKNILAAITLAGTGKLVMTTIPNTYGWKLQGNNTAYAAFWSMLFNSASRKSRIGEDLAAGNNISRRSESVELLLETDNHIIPRVQIGGSTLALAQDPFLPNKWQGRYWPEKPGWQASIGTRGEQHWWYAFSSDDWPEPEMLKARQDTRDYANKWKGLNDPSRVDNAGYPTVIPSWWFVLLFFLACILLWVERKLD
jgi:hypothetical protein